MKNVLIALIVLALAIPAIAGQNPNIHIYLYTTSTGLAGANHKASPAAGANTSVYVCFDNFGVGGGMFGAEWKFIEVPGPDFLSTTNQFAGVGGLTIGDPHDATGCAMTVGAVPVYPTNGVVVLARIRYETPEELSRGGTITVVPYNGVSRNVADANNDVDSWCVHHSTGHTFLSGNFAWDSDLVPEGDEGCGVVSPVESSTWGSIKALYR